MRRSWNRKQRSRKPQNINAESQGKHNLVIARVSTSPSLESALFTGLTPKYRTIGAIPPAYTEEPNATPVNREKVSPSAPLLPSPQRSSHRVPIDTFNTINHRLNGDHSSGFSFSPSSHRTTNGSVAVPAPAKFGRPSSASVPLVDRFESAEVASESR